MNKFIMSFLGVLCVSAVNSCTTPPAASPNWLHGYRYRIPLTIEEKSGAHLTDYQVKIEIQGIDPNQPNCVDFSRIQHIPGGGVDVMFTDQTHQPINFWVKSWDDTNKTATIWVKVPKLTAYQKTTVYMYYGNKSQLPMTNDQFDRTMTKLSADDKTRGLWHLDEGGGSIRDSSPNENHSCILKARWLGKDGGQFDGEPSYNFSRGNALVLDGKSEYIEIPHKKLLSFTGSDKISIEAWVNPLTATDSTDYRPIISKIGNYSLYLTKDNRLACFFYGPKPEDYYFSNSPITPNVWSHLVITYDGDNIRFYLNGRLDNKIPLEGMIKPCLDRIHNVDYETAPLYFGYEPNPRFGTELTAEVLAPRFFSGVIDEVRVLARVLPDGEIKADYERRKYSSVEPQVTLGEEEHQ